MIIRVCTFTRQGEEKARQLFENWQEMIPQYREGGAFLGQWTGECFQRHLPILFVGASGIAVRAIAPYVKDKLSDGAVLVMDEKGEFVIPLLSGHMGGANELAERIANRIGATPVITTATDVEGLFSVDVFAKKNGLRIVNREGIRRVSAKLLSGETVTITWEEEIEAAEPRESEGASENASKGSLPSGLRYVPYDESYADVRIVTEAGYQALCENAKNAACGSDQTKGDAQAILLVAKDYALGIGCKKGKTFEELQTFLEKVFQSEALPMDWERICGIASIDLKAREEGLWGLAQFYHLPFQTYSAEQLQAVEGDFTKSEFVRDVTGVDNVCERAALCMAGSVGELVTKKTAENGMTAAIAKRKIRLEF